MVNKFETMPPARELEDHLATVRMALFDWEREGSFVRYSYLRNLLICFPELQESAEELLDKSGLDGDLSALLGPLLARFLRPEDAALAAFEDLPLSVVGTRQAAAEIASVIASPGTQIPQQDSLYLATSLDILRRKLVHKPQDHLKSRTATMADLAQLRALLSARPEAVPPATLQPRINTPEQVLMLKSSFDDISRLQTGYANYLRDERAFEACIHDPKSFFSFGPYLSLLPGRYRVELDLEVDKTAHLRCTITEFPEQSVQGIVRSQFDLAPGASTFVTEFDWTPELTDYSVEVRLQVLSPKYVNVRMTGFRMSYSPENRTVTESTI